MVYVGVCILLNFILTYYIKYEERSCSLTACLIRTKMYFIQLIYALYQFHHTARGFETFFAQTSRYGSFSLFLKNDR